MNARVWFFLEVAYKPRVTTQIQNQNFKTKSLGSYLGRPPWFMNQGGCFEVTVPKGVSPLTVPRVRALPGNGGSRGSREDDAGGLGYRRARF